MREMCQTFGITALGETVESWTLENEFLTAEVLTYGATLRRLVFGGVDVVLGYDTLSEYERNDGYVGATVGRVCNRIGGASFGLNGKTYPLAKNDGGNHLHGGARGFDKYIWAAELLEDGLRLRRLSPDGEEGYPGTLAVSVTYRLAGESLRIEYEAESDADTLCSLTNHSYFNLNGGGTAMAHTLTLAAGTYLETSPGCLPTGRALPVAGTPFDFRAAKAVGRDIDTAAEQLRLVNGYDHHFCVDGAGLRRAAVLRGDSSGIAMTMDTTSPGVQLYTANWLSRRDGKNGAVYEPRCAVCLEPQFPPDAVHHPDFPQPLLRRGEVYRHCTVYSFQNNNTSPVQRICAGDVLLLLRSAHDHAYLHLCAGCGRGKHIPGDGCSIHGDGSDSLFYVVRILYSDAVDCTAVAALDGIACPFRGDTGIDGKALQRGLHAENGLRDADERPGCRAGEPAVLVLAEGGRVQNGPVARLAEVGVRSGNEPQRVIVKAAAHSQVALLGQGLVLVIGAAVGELGGGNVQDAFPRPLGDHVDDAQQVLTGVTEAHAQAQQQGPGCAGGQRQRELHGAYRCPAVSHAAGAGTVFYRLGLYPGGDDGAHAGVRHRLL